MDLTLPNLANEKYLLLPSDLDGLASVFIALLRPSDGIIEPFVDLTLVARAKEAFVGVVMALGSLVAAASAIGVSAAAESAIDSYRGAGRVVEVSSSARCLARFPGAVFSSRPVSATVRSDLDEPDFDSPLA